MCLFVDPSHDSLRFFQNQGKGSFQLQERILACSAAIMATLVSGSQGPHTSQWPTGPGAPGGTTACSASLKQHPQTASPLSWPVMAWCMPVSRLSTHRGICSKDGHEDERGDEEDELARLVLGGGEAVDEGSEWSEHGEGNPEKDANRPCGLKARRRSSGARRMYFSTTLLCQRPISLTASAGHPNTTRPCAPATRRE